MAEFPLVSIVTPSYNQSAFIKETIESVLSQDYPAFEYWVIDGGSTDGSLEIIRQYQDRLSGWISEPDQGQAEAINKGLLRTSGEIVAWLNSDDLYRPHAIRSAVQTLQKHPEVGLVYSNVDSIDEDGVIFNRMTYEQWNLADLMAFKILGQVSVFFRRSVLEKAGLLDLSYHYLLDHHLWLRMAIHAPIKYVAGEVWGAARMHGGAKNVAAAEGFAREAISLANWMAEDHRFRTQYQAHKRKIWAGAYRLNGFYLLNEGKPGDALKAYWHSFWKDPLTALKDWRRIGFALLSPFKPDKLRDRYLAQKKKRLNEVEK
jgi:glycosyltransferase involved in cell wall biosynthesis